MGGQLELVNPDLTYPARLPRVRVSVAVSRPHRGSAALRTTGGPATPHTPAYDFRTTTITTAPRRNR